MNNPLATHHSGSEMPAAPRPSTAGAPQLFQPLKLPISEPFRTSKTFAVAKLALEFSNLVFAMIAFILIMLAFRLKTELSWEDAWELWWLDSVYLSLAVVSILWHLVGHITFAIGRELRTICPGAHVGVYLILWALAVSVVTLYCLKLAYELYHIRGHLRADSFCEGMHDKACWFYSFPSQDKYLSITEALTAFSVIMLILHFTLLVMACVETDRKIRYEKKKKIVYLVAAPGRADSRMYCTPLAQPPQPNEGTGLTTEPSHHDEEGIAASR